MSVPVCLLSIACLREKRPNIERLASFDFRLKKKKRNETDRFSQSVSTQTDLFLENDSFFFLEMGDKTVTEPTKRFQSLTFLCLREESVVYVSLNTRAGRSSALSGSCRLHLTASHGPPEQAGPSSVPVLQDSCSQTILLEQWPSDSYVALSVFTGARVTVTNIWRNQANNDTRPTAMLRRDTKASPHPMAIRTVDRHKYIAPSFPLAPLFLKEVDIMLHRQLIIILKCYKVKH